MTLLFISSRQSPKAGTKAAATPCRVVVYCLRSVDRAIVVSHGSMPLAGPHITTSSYPL